MGRHGHKPPNPQKAPKGHGKKPPAPPPRPGRSVWDSCLVVAVVGAGALALAGVAVGAVLDRVLS